jgi:methionyl-tRNA formyltransferase
MRIAFMGTPDFAVPTLDALAAAGHDIAAVYSQPPRPAGRGKAPRPTPTQRRAETLGIPVRTPLSLRDVDEQEAFAALDPEMAVVAAYGLILPLPILHAPLRGCLNVHASLLPRWRGAAPVQRAILAGDEKTGVTIMAMARGLDTGPMLAKAALPIGAQTAGELTGALALAGANLLAQVIGDLGRYPPVDQPESGITYAAKIDKSEARIDFNQSANMVERQVRAFNPAPGAFIEYAGERIRLLAAEIADGAASPGTVLDDRLSIACAEGAIRPTLVQRAGRAPMPAADLLRGFAVPPGTILA